MPSRPQPNIISLTDYEPFGMNFQGRSFIGENSRYAYQGSERDQEYLSGSAYTTEFRMLDVRLGRWFSTDAITHPWQSTYCSMDNNPITMTDVLGLEGEGNSGNFTMAPHSNGYTHGSYSSSTGLMGSQGGNFGFDFASFAGQASPTKIPMANPAIANTKNAEGIKILSPSSATRAQTTTNANIDVLVWEPAPKQLSVLVVPPPSSPPAGNNKIPNKQANEGGDLTNPTGLGIRNDAGGQGTYGASRGNRPHYGLDFQSVDGQDIISPVAGRVMNSSFVNKKGITVPTVVIIPSNPNLGFNKLELLYVGPSQGGWRDVNAGDVIGQSVNLQGLGYPSIVGPHIHLQMKLDKTPVNPTSYFGF